MGPEGSNTHVSTRVMGTYGYAAPEYISTGNCPNKWVNWRVFDPFFIMLPSLWKRSESMICTNFKPYTFFYTISSKDNQVEFNDLCQLEEQILQCENFI